MIFIFKDFEPTFKGLVSTNKVLVSTFKVLELNFLSGLWETYIGFLGKLYRLPWKVI